MQPNILLDTLNAELRLGSDDELSRYLELPAAVIHDLRCQFRPVSPEVIVVINERTGISVAKIRAMIAIEPALRHQVE
ncbi:MAG: hypothetical protein H7327_03440 [Herminiimonas sp.]|nr:hypothetical protein [Herminiimonas sp.]